MRSPWKRGRKWIQPCWKPETRRRKRRSRKLFAFCRRILRLWSRWMKWLFPKISSRRKRELGFYLISFSLEKNYEHFLSKEVSWYTWLVDWLILPTSIVVHGIELIDWLIEWVSGRLREVKTLIFSWLIDWFATYTLMFLKLWVFLSLSFQSPNEEDTAAGGRWTGAEGAFIEILVTLQSLSKFGGTG